MKDLYIFENYETKATIELSDYDNGTPTFQGFLFKDNEKEKTGSPSTCKDQKVINVKRKKPAPIAHAGRKVDDAEPQSSACTG